MPPNVKMSPVEKRTPCTGWSTRILCRLAKLIGLVNKNQMLERMFDF